MSELFDKKMKFARLLPRLLDHIFESGYAATIGDVQRSWAGKDAFEAAAASVSAGDQGLFDRLRRKIFYGSEISLHRLGLAVDINLFKFSDGTWTYLTQTEDHAVFGAWWKSLDADCQWGGEGTRNDGNHYSIGYKGRW